MTKRKKILPESVERRWGKIVYRTPGEIYPVKKLFFIRHAHYMRYDNYGLSPLGRRQAARLAKRFRDEPVDAIHFSLAARARETAEIIAKHHPDAKMHANRELHEVYPPFMSTARKKGQPVREWREIRAKMKHDNHRMDRIFEKFFRPAHRNRLELIVCHGNVIRTVFLRMLGIKKLAEGIPATRNAAVTEIHVDSTGQPWLYSYEDVGHLPANMVSIT